MSPFATLEHVCTAVEDPSSRLARRARSSTPNPYMHLRWLSCISIAQALGAVLCASGAAARIAGIDRAVRARLCGPQRFTLGFCQVALRAHLVRTTITPLHQELSYQLLDDSRTTANPHATRNDHIPSIV
eukprot:4192631-Pleurochrysis_carterae.AAC.1